MIRVVVAENNVLLREGVVKLIDSQSDLSTVAAVGDLLQLLAAIEEHQPEVVVTDIRMPPTGIDEGIRVSEELRQNSPDTGVVLLCDHAEPDYVLELFDETTEGRAYLVRERAADADELARAIREVAKGRSAIR